MGIILEKLKEVLLAVLPITVIVLVLHFFVVPIETSMLIRFLIGAVFIIFGLTIFLAGVDIGITPMGELMGNSLTRKNKLWIVIAAGLVLGFLISVAEPALYILADQIDVVTSGQLQKLYIIVFVSIGISLLFAFGLVRILYNIPLYKILVVAYVIIFILAYFVKPEFMSMAFDLSGATTGVLAVPFILALALGISAFKKDSKASEKDSFGLVAIASTGPIIIILIMGLFLNDNSDFTQIETIEYYTGNSLLAPYVRIIPNIALESIMALSPLVLIFITFNFIAFKLNTRHFLRIIKGMFYALLGLTLFLIGVNAGFMDLGIFLGATISNSNNTLVVVIIGFILGLVTILAEPAVHVLTHQIEEVTSGYIKKGLVLIALSLGVGIAVGLSMLRIMVPQIQLWHYLVPGYAIAIALSFIVPKLFVGIAFDAGGVATGPMTSAFILAFTQGAAYAVDGASILVDGFGMIAAVAMMPIITLQMLGAIYKIKTRKKGVN